MNDILTTKPRRFDAIVAAIALGIALVGCDSSQPLPAAQPTVYINEFMAENDSTIQDPDGNGGYADWIELYNAETTAIDLGGMYLTDDVSQPKKWRIPDGITIAARGYVIFWADNDPDQGDVHASFQLARSGEAIALFATDANENRMIDMLVFGEQGADVSFGRFPDGVEAWQTMTRPSPAAANVAD